MTTRQLAPVRTPTSLSMSFTPMRSGVPQRAAIHLSSFSPHPASVPPIVHEVLRSPNQPLDTKARAFMEPRFGYDFSRVAVGVQTKLAISQQGDIYEQEADRMADRVMRMPTLSFHGKSDEGCAEGVASSNLGGGVVPSVISRKADRGDQSLADHQPRGQGLGQPLDRSTREFFEPRFGHDFGHVRIHADAAAAEASARLGARAFAIGNEIWFGSRQYHPDTAEGKQLLAHELTHVIQQGKPNSPAATIQNARRAPPSKPIAASLSAVPTGQAQAVPAVTGVTLPAPAEVGVGAGARSIAVSAVVAGNPPITWTLVGAPAGVTVVGNRRQATVRATGAAAAAAGGNFQVRAALTATPGDNFTSANIALVGIANVTLTPVPPFANQGIWSGPAVAPAAPVLPALGGVADPNRGGLAGNTVNVAVVTAPAGRANTVTLPRALGATVGGAMITPGITTGNALVRVTDNATRSNRDAPLVIQPVPLFLRGFGPSPATPAGRYGAAYPLRFQSSDTTGVLDRVVGETITLGGGDDFGFPINPPTGPNAAPIAGLADQANSWTDNLFRPVGAIAGAAANANLINVNRFVGPGVAVPLPAIQSLRQGFHFQGWGGVWSNEFDHGLHVRSLRGTPANFIFRTEFPFSRATGTVRNNPYVGPPLIVLSGITLNAAALPAAPLAAGGLAADGVAVGGVRVVPGVAGRLVNWSIVSGAITFAAGAAANPVAAAATLQAGLAPGNFRVRVADTVFPNRRVEGNVRVVAVRLRGIAAPVRTVPAGTLAAIVNLTADPGGRVIIWAVDPVAAARGVTVVGAPVVGAAAAAAARTATVTRPAAFTGRVTVTASDSIRPAASASIVITFR